MKFALLVIAVAMAVAVGGTMSGTKIFGLSPGAFAAVLALSLIALANIGWYVTEHRGRLSTTALQALAWIGIFAVVIVGHHDDLAPFEGSQGLDDFLLVVHGSARSQRAVGQ